MALRQLTKEEILQLENQLCSSTDWSGIRVDTEFDPLHVHHVHFSGTCHIGATGKQIDTAEGVRNAGIYNSHIHQCVIDDHVYIANVGKISNYHIGSEVIIENVNQLAVSGTSSFGNGIEVEVLNEGGGRELIIFDSLYAQLAYIFVIHRENTGLSDHIKDKITAYCRTKTGSEGKVEAGSTIHNVNTIKNVMVSKGVTIKGATHLENGSIIGDPEDMTFVGSGVIAKDFIIQSGSRVDTGALIDKCFVGQGVRIGKQFSAENSVLFANSEGFHSEAVSLFGGPYTVTHHKSTLLIAGMYSFYNAGSGTNQSNHMYKLGPVHQGIVERGSKTGSFSYLLWPSRVGCYSVVMDKHGGNFDSSDLPFSYLTVEGGRTMLTPAMNLITVGTKRDSEKWPKRDRRKAAEKLDLIHFDLFNPYVVSNVVRGIDILNDLYEKTSKEQEAVNFKGTRIKRLMLKSCRKYYEMVLPIFLGNQLIRKLSALDKSGLLSDLKREFADLPAVDFENWVDIAGLVAPRDRLEDLLEDIRKDRLKDLDEIRNQIKALYDQYPENCWKYALYLFGKRFDLTADNLSKERLREIIEEWEKNAVRLNNMILSDAKKEFDPGSRIGYGHGGGEEAIEVDFEAVRGNYEDNSFVISLIEENQLIEKKSRELIREIEEMK